MTDYQAALEQFTEETGQIERDFRKNIDVYGWGYVSFYYKRWIEAQR